MRSIELWCAIAHQRISGFRVWSFPLRSSSYGGQVGPSRNDGVQIMIPVTSFAGKTVAVFGLGGSGLSCCPALKAGGVEVIAGDDYSENVAEAAQDDFISGDLRMVSWRNFDALILTPGAPLTHPATH